MTKHFRSINAPYGSCACCWQSYCCCSALRFCSGVTHLDRDFFEWVFLLVGYISLATLMLDIIARYRVRGVYDLMMVAALYGLLNSLLLNPQSAFEEVPTHIGYSCHRRTWHSWVWKCWACSWCWITGHRASTVLEICCLGIRCGWVFSGASGYVGRPHSPPGSVDEVSLDHDVRCWQWCNLAIALVTATIAYSPANQATFEPFRLTSAACGRGNGCCWYFIILFMIQAISEVYADEACCLVFQRCWSWQD